jgi:hypothetical protein
VMSDEETRLTNITGIIIFSIIILLRSMIILRTHQKVYVRGIRMYTSVFEFIRIISLFHIMGLVVTISSHAYIHRLDL